MILSFEKEIDLTTYEHNPEPKVVQQLSIAHEAFNGDITQYYINEDSFSEGDKASNAIGIPHKNPDNTIYYTYTDYDELKWSQPGARVTRQRIDRLGIKVFPNEGAIAHYKLAYQNISKILAPVNYKAHRTKAPSLQATINPDDTVTFTIVPPLINGVDDVEYQCYRIVMALGLNRLEYILYETSITIPKVLVTGTYECYAIGYVNEGEICSDNSNELLLTLQGDYEDWPDITPGAEDLYIKKLQFTNDGHLVGVLSNNETVTSDNTVPTGGSTVSIEPTLSAGTKIADFEIDGQSGELYAPTPVASKYLTGLHFEDDGTLKATMSDGSTVTSDNAFKMTILKYGISTWDDFITAYTAQKIVYCRASSNSNPASGNQTRLAFMAYLNNETNPTNVEFQYYRSVATHSDSQQGDQVFVYKLDKTAGWTVTTRNAFTKIAVGTGLTKSYSNGTLTISLA